MIFFKQINHNYYENYHGIITMEMTKHNPANTFSFVLKRPPLATFHLESRMCYVYSILLSLHYLTQHIRVLLVNNCHTPYAQDNHEIENFFKLAPAANQNPEL